MSTLNITPLQPAPLAPIDAATPAQPPQRKLKDPRPADKNGFWWGTGRRKTAVARVRIRLNTDGKPKFLIQGTVNKEYRTVDAYFTELRDQRDAQAPLGLSKLEGKFDIFVKCHGGGFMGQAGAIRLGLSRALVGYDPTSEAALRDAGYLTRDAREVERKKYGQAGARRRFQFSKR